MRQPAPTQWIMSCTCQCATVCPAVCLVAVSGATTARHTLALLVDADRSEGAFDAAAHGEAGRYPNCHSWPQFGRKDSGPNDARIVLRNCAPSPLHCAHLLARRQVLELDIHDDYKTTDCKEFLRVMLAVGETFILLHPPSPFSRCFNVGEEGVSVK